MQFGSLVTFFLAGCVTDDFGNKRGYTDTEKGAMIGAAGGMLLGALVSKDAPAKGARGTGWSFVGGSLRADSGSARSNAYTG